MHYYKRNLGDYAKKAGGLNMLQHGAYTLLIDACYDREVFPTLEQAIEWAWAKNDDEINAVKMVLSRFFVLCSDGTYTQDRILQELLEYHAKADKNKEIAVNRELKKKENSTKRERSVQEREPNQEPITNNHNNKNIVDNDVLDCPQQEIVNLYKQILPNGIQPLTWTGSRANLLKARWRESKKRQNIDWWQGLFEYITKSPFLMGQSSSADRKPFTISLDWIVKSENFMKITEGKYHA